MMECVNNHQRKEEKTVSKITTIGLDLAKHVFHVVCCDGRGKLVSKRMLKRRQVLTFFAALPPCRIGMEACAGAHYWARQLQARGHEVILIPAQYVKAYVRGNKNDYNDARAIAEAACPCWLLFTSALEIRGLRGRWPPDKSTTSGLDSG